MEITPTSVADVLRSGSLRSVFQPIVDLATGAVVAQEALVRGPVGPLERPDLLFAAAREEGLLAELDAACRLSAVRAAVEHGLVAPLTLFVNVEPEVLETAPLDDLVAALAESAGQLRVVLEITERALAHRPAHLLEAVERVRALGWGIALDDVGADSLSLAFMPLLRPDVIKLDLRLVQQRPDGDVAQIMNAVNAHAERTGALVLAEGIETEQHLRIARGLGATLGQGWMFGRPVAAPVVDHAVAITPLPLPQVVPDVARDTSPFACLPAGAVLRQSPKSLLIALSKQLEREALTIGATCLVAATFQEERHFTPATRLRYTALAEQTGFVAAFGEGLPTEPLPGVRGADLAEGDPVRGEWDIVVVGPHFAAALLARDLGDTGPDADRTFEYALTYDRETVAAAARSLLSRVLPRRPLPAPGAAELTAPEVATADGTGEGAPAGAGVPAAADVLLHRALAASINGITISDMTRPGQPLVFANRAFEELSGFGAVQVLGRNCRFLQGPDTDPVVVTRIREAIAAGRECTETLLNYRGSDRTPWWNEIHLAPVADASGAVVQYIGVQNDVTSRVEAQQALAEERERTREYLSRIEHLAQTDPLTGLLNRRRITDALEAVVWDARLAGTAAAVLFLDLDGFKPVNDAFGHAAGDEVLQAVAVRLRGRLRHSDLIARIGGDEFLVVLPGLEAASAAEHARSTAAQLAAVVAEPVTVSTAAQPVVVRASIGVATSAGDGHDPEQLLQVADARMFEAKRVRSRARA